MGEINSTIRVEWGWCTFGLGLTGIDPFFSAFSRTCALKTIFTFSFPVTLTFGLLDVNFASPVTGHALFPLNLKFLYGCPISSKSMAMGMTDGQTDRVTGCNA